jgi:ABC-type taurine transport system ATPase subunit
MSERDVSEDQVRAERAQSPYLALIRNRNFSLLWIGQLISFFGDRIHQVLDMVGLWERRGSLVRTFSGGMQRRLEIARGLPPDLEATVITNSPPIAVALAEHPAVEVTMLGGRLAKDAQAVVGAATVEALHAVRADVLVLGVCSLHPEVGITVMDLEESYVKRAMIENAAEVVAVSSAEKLGSAAPYVVAPLDELTHLVTERSVPADTLAQYRELGIEVVPA